MTEHKISDTLSINEILLDEVSTKLRDNPDVAEFFTVFKTVEEEHVNNFLSKENFNLRAASLCAEAYGVAQLMENIIKNPQPE